MWSAPWECSGRHDWKTGHVAGSLLAEYPAEDGAVAHCQTQSTVLAGADRAGDGDSDSLEVSRATDVNGAHSCHRAMFHGLEEAPMEDQEEHATLLVGIETESKHSAQVLAYASDKQRD